MAAWLTNLKGSEKLCLHKNFIISFISPVLSSDSCEIQHLFSTFGIHVSRNDLFFWEDVLNSRLQYDFFVHWLLELQVNSVLNLGTWLKVGAYYLICYHSLQFGKIVLKASLHLSGTFFWHSYSFCRRNWTTVMITFLTKLKNSTFHVLTIINVINRNGK